MTIQEYEVIEKKVKDNFDKMPQWVKQWSIELLEEMLEVVKKSN